MQAAVPARSGAAVVWTLAVLMLSLRKTRRR
jgi:hypothetical protein